jgi:hypothetical protein
MFEMGAGYTRRAINAEIGGNMQGCLPTRGGHVVGVCFVKKMNPNGPNVILVGRGRDKEKAASLLASQQDAVPVFVKIEKNSWKYLGLFRAQRYDPFPHKEYVDASRRTDVVGTLFLSEVA